ncbi:bifunctional PIG-L family deacetylase/class I SAM-dependent methyltransferase [Microbacterium oleivorans]|uniref:bifunctional PIG-L family deacetylase/class I SAM-dependent methyltransferase n=1 Tax=Microbacterium oleivorans TaxID=273677 RepID=UPI00211602FC|nr:bifunctional PIG-L family deacetylase/class I SAM-dependent methyltransferase [Microbacterium oleivorans]
MVSFSHRDPGTPEAVWRAAIDDRDLAPLDEDVERLVVVAAHPDDETLGAGGLMARTARRGVPVTVLIATDGEGSHPGSPTYTPARLAALRRREATEALARLGGTIRTVFLGLPDGRTDEHRDTIRAAVRDAVLTGGSARESADASPAGDALVIAPWTGDGHRDHRVVGEVVAGVCDELGARSRFFPIWLWHWGLPADAPWDDLEIVRLDASSTAAKDAATRAHRSQTEPLSAAPGDEVMLHAGMQSHFDRPFEIFVRPSRSAPSLPQEFFDAFYDRNGDDPWGFDSRWYEQRKRAATLASLPRRRYRSGLELGCSTGALTAQLAERTDHLLALDIADAPLAAARRRLGDRADVRLERAALPHEWPTGTYDLIVLSEVGYYWSEADLVAAVGRMTSSLTPDGHLIACHWRHPVAEYPLSGDRVHAALAAEKTLTRLVLHLEDDFLLEVYAGPSARSVAVETGILA